MIEGDKVKKGDTLAVIEHNDLKAMLASRQAQAERTAAELDEERADLWAKEREDYRVTRLYNQKKATAEEYEKAQAEHKKASARVAATRSERQAREVEYRRDQGDNRHDAPVCSV